MITQAQRNAALLAAHTEIEKIITHFVPGMFMGYAQAYIQANPQLIANISDACLNAADKAAVPAAVPSPTLPTPPILPEATSVQHPSTD